MSRRMSGITTTALVLTAAFLAAAADARAHAEFLPSPATSAAERVAAR